MVDLEVLDQGPSRILSVVAHFSQDHREEVVFRGYELHELVVAGSWQNHVLCELEFEAECAQGGLGGLLLLWQGDQDLCKLGGL